VKYDEHIVDRLCEIHCEREIGQKSYCSTVGGHRKGYSWTWGGESAKALLCLASRWRPYMALGFPWKKRQHGRGRGKLRKRLYTLHFSLHPAAKTIPAGKSHVCFFGLWP